MAFRVCSQHFQLLVVGIAAPSTQSPLDAGRRSVDVPVLCKSYIKKFIYLVLFEGDNVIGRDGKCDITIPIKVRFRIRIAYLMSIT